MRATPADIQFARQVEDTLRSAGARRAADDLYFCCLQIEQLAIADAYAAAAKTMEDTGQWTMPTDAELRAINRAAWAVLHQ